MVSNCSYERDVRNSSTRNFSTEPTMRSKISDYNTSTVNKVSRHSSINEVFMNTNGGWTFDLVERQ
ncbi:MAG: hypothetical protein IH849_09465 [Acidobacteria bacterium]|nr:hypothetical protein [Acidobacteriota bacterium]